MTEPSEIGMRVKQLRLKKHMTQKALAKRSGVSWSFISRLENGQSHASVSTLAKIATAVGEDLGLLLSSSASDMQFDYPLQSALLKLQSFPPEYQTFMIQAIDHMDSLLREQHGIQE